MLHGGDYNPEQWMHIDGVWDEDMRLMDLAHCNAMSVGIFSWVSLEPEEGRFEFGWLDRVMDMLAEHGAYAVLATPSGAKPAWMSARYPEIRRVGYNGLRDPHQGRHNHCYTSPVYREKIEIINRMLAERYKDHPALLVWHVSNEYGGECHCDLCYEAFQQWLQERYASLDELNQAWWTRFWSHCYTAWEQIDHIDYSVHAMVLDWKRFVTHQTLDFFRHESAPLREITPDVPVTINMMGTYPGLNYWQFAPHVDVIAWDSYPRWHGVGHDWELAVHISFLHDLNRSMKHGKPFMLMESTPSATNWMTVGRPKRPGMHLLSSLQAVAHGSDSVQYFQWRKSRGSAEKFHGAVVDHAGHEHTRVFRDVATVGEALARLDPVVGASVEPEVALIYDWENAWALEEARGPRNEDKDYVGTCTNHYRQFWLRGIPVDIVDAECDLSGYRLVVAPMLYMLRAGVADRIRDFVHAGGTFVTTYLSGQVDNHDLCFLGGFPGPLREVLGVWAEETDVFYDSQVQRLVAERGLDSGLSGEYAVRHYADRIHSEGAEVLATYGCDFYAGEPALTRNAYGEGWAYYIAARSDECCLHDFYGSLANTLALRRVLDTELPTGVTAQMRRNDNGEFIFLMNFTTAEQTVALGETTYNDILSSETITGDVTLPGYGVRVLSQ
jgi:beta-galactosidase